MSDRKTKVTYFVTVVLFTIALGAGTIHAQPKNYTLQQCIDRALDTSFPLHQSKNFLRMANADRLSAYGAFLPRINWRMDASYTHLVLSGYIDQSTGQFTPASIFRDSHGYGASLTADMNLFNGLSKIFDLRSAGAVQSQRRHEVNSRELSAAYDVKSKYFNLLKAQTTLEIRQKAVERNQELMKISETRYELGSASLSDVLKAKVSLSQAQLDLLSAENTVKTSQANLAYAIGEAIDQEIQVSDVELSGSEVTFEEAKTRAMNNNPDYLAAIEESEARRNDLLSARGSYLPQVSIGAGKSWEGEELGQINEWWDDNYRTAAYAQLTFNIFNGFDTRRQTEYAKAQLNIAEYNVLDTKRSMALEVREAYLDLQERIAARELAEEQYASAEEDYKLAEEKYALGAATILDILDAEVSLKTAESDRVDSKYNYYLALARLQTVMGVIE